MKTIEEFLRERIGLDRAATGPTAIERVVRRRMRILGFTRLEDYYDRLLSASKEYQELIESVVVTETWFFRDPEALATLASIAVGKWLPTHPAATLRVLSLPCSSGEEAFSIVMALVDAGMPPNRVQVDAVDVSLHALDRAQHGVYGKNAFRGKDLAFRERHFRSAGEDFALNHGVRQQVCFMPGNLLSADFAAPHTQYDFIFCRNLLIYLHRDAQAQALHKIERLLDGAGLLFVGAAELSVALDLGFISAELPLAFACRKRSFGASWLTGLTVTPPADSNPRFPSDDQTLCPAPPDLAHARQLADAGRLIEAAAICESHLRQSQTSAQAYYLLGLVRDARGDSSAIECYRKALYLEPNHYETLVQLAFLAHKNGDPAGARQFHRRAQRLQPESNL